MARYYGLAFGCFVGNFALYAIVDKDYPRGLATGFISAILVLSYGLIANRKKSSS